VGLWRPDDTLAGHACPEGLIPSAAAVEREPVSPELVLVDPELARRERARLEEKAYLDGYLDTPFSVAALRREVEVDSTPVDVDASGTWRDAADFSRRRLLPALLLISLLANGLFVAVLVARTGNAAQSQEQAAVRVTTGEESAPAHSTLPPESATLRTEAAPSHPPRTLRGRSTHRIVTKAFVERRLVALIMSAPARKLPPQFIDSTTGLIKNNVQVICRRRSARAFMCLVRVQGAAARAGIYVKYRQKTSSGGLFKWYGYKQGSPG
jgi:hypothetical protein